jgi:hypothetical protein
VPNAFIHIRSAKFPILPGEDGELVHPGMYGKAHAHYLQERLIGPIGLCERPIRDSESRRFIAYWPAVRATPTGMISREASFPDSMLPPPITINDASPRFSMR